MKRIAMYLATAAFGSGPAHCRRRLGANGRARPDEQLLRNAHEDVHALARLLDRQRLLVPCSGRSRSL
jgi:hypothetical protein